MMMAELATQCRFFTVRDYSVKSCVVVAPHSCGLLIIANHHFSRSSHDSTQA